MSRPLSSYRLHRKQQPEFTISEMQKYNQTWQKYKNVADEEVKGFFQNFCHNRFLSLRVPKKLTPYEKKIQAAPPQKSFLCPVQQCDVISSIPSLPFSSTTGETFPQGGHFFQINEVSLYFFFSSKNLAKLQDLKCNSKPSKCILKISKLLQLQ